MLALEIRFPHILDAPRIVQKRKMEEIHLCWDPRETADLFRTHAKRTFDDT
jgi:hypothetical protein